MKSLLISLVVSGAFLVGSTASAAVFVHAGPVNVAVSRSIGHVHPVYRPVAVRPIVPAPVIAPIVPAVWPRGVLTPAERAEIRNEVWETRREIWNAIHN